MFFFSNGKSLNLLALILLRLGLDILSLPRDGLKHEGSTEGLLGTENELLTWKPVLMVCTEQELWQVMHWRKNSLVSLLRMVSGDLQVWQVTYSLM